MVEGCASVQFVIMGQVAKTEIYCQPTQTTQTYHVRIDWGEQGDVKFRIDRVWREEVP